jgi:hypothetical protein
MDGYLSKPLMVPALREALERWNICEPTSSARSLDLSARR